ncbi:MAG TPA: sigma-70 family RNA polymerase sigma factor [Mucilaginibacter sp.]|nr:sigma-70 family RNA polymerase sigma factor [Mucilaginibacter sp.]
MDNSYNTQQALVEQLLRRDPAGCRHLCESYSSKLYGYIIRIVNNREAADRLLEQTFKKICDNINLYQHSQLTFLSWALQIARAESISYLCPETRTKTQNDRRMQPDASAIQTTVFDMVQQGYKVFEIAEILNIPIDMVKLNIRKAMKQHN